MEYKLKYLKFIYNILILMLLAIFGLYVEVTYKLLLPLKNNLEFLLPEILFIYFL